MTPNGFRPAHVEAAVGLAAETRAFDVGGAAGATVAAGLSRNVQDASETRAHDASAVSNAFMVLSPAGSALPRGDRHPAARRAQRRRREILPRRRLARSSAPCRPAPVPAVPHRRVRSDPRSDETGVAFDSHPRQGRPIRASDLGASEPADCRRRAGPVRSAEGGGWRLPDSGVHGVDTCFPAATAAPPPAEPFSFDRPSGRGRAPIRSAPRPRRHACSDGAVARRPAARRAAHRPTGPATVSRPPPPPASRPRDRPGNSA